MLERVISGGQTGADIAGLKAAAASGISTGGTAPKGFLTENGCNPDLGKIYGLVARGGYKSRTIQNIKDSDGTIVFLIHHSSGGSTKTIGYCQTGKWVYGLESKPNGFRPVLVISKSEMEDKVLEKTCAKIVQWILDHHIHVLNVAGHRRSTNGELLWNYEKRVEEILTLVFMFLKMM